MVLSNLFSVHVHEMHTYWSQTIGVDEVIYFSQQPKKSI